MSKRAVLIVLACALAGILAFVLWPRRIDLFEACSRVHTAQVLRDAGGSEADYRDRIGEVARAYETESLDVFDRDLDAVAAGAGGRAERNVTLMCDGIVELSPEP